MSQRETIAAQNRAKQIVAGETLDLGSSASAAEAPTQSVASLPRATGPTRIGRFRIERLLGQGGMGAVFLAYDEELDRRVALKIPRFDRDAPEVKERFYREARAAAAVEHPNICPIYDVGESEGKLYLAMAYIEGQTLSEIVSPGKALRQRHVAQVVRKIALALAAAHARGVVHRDLKPANIMLAPGKGPVVMDFGLAVRRASGDDRLTRTGIVMGTPAYMSPEQVSGDPDAVGPASDLYSLGVILYELLAGHPPFLGNLAEILGHIALSEPPPLTKFRQDVDRELEAICLRAMAKRPAERFASMNEFAAAIDRYLKRQAPPAPPSLPPSAPTVASPPLTAEAMAASDLLAAMAELPTATAARETRVAAVNPSPQAISPWPAVQAKAPSARVARTLPRRNATWLPVAGVGAVAMVAILAVVLLLRTPTGRIRIELSDPAAQVEVKVDGENVKRSSIGYLLELPAGKHHVLVAGKNFETVSESFTVRKNGESVLRIQLTSTEDESSGSEAAAASEAASTTANASSIATTLWTDINPSLEPSWRWDAENKSRSYVSILNGVLTLDNGGVNFPRWYHDNLIIKAQIKFVSGRGSVGLTARNYYAHATKRDGQIHLGIGENLKNGRFRELAVYRRNDIYPEFFELEFSAIRDQLTVQLNGERIMQVRATGATEQGAGLNAFRAKGMFKNVQVRKP